MPGRVGWIAAMLVAGGGWAGPAAAQLVNASVTELNLDFCTVMQSDDFGSIWACPGLRGMPVMIAERDQHFMVSFGLKSTEEKAAEQTLPPRHHLDGEIEWRVSNRDGAWKPFATILRYVIAPEAGRPEGEVLVVSKVAEGATCHVAYIDALANAEALVLAQQTADAKAPDFDCAGEPEIVGTFEAWAR